MLMEDCQGVVTVTQGESIKDDMRTASYSAFIDSFTHSLAETKEPELLF